jgi:hypothetical protein
LVEQYLYTTHMAIERVNICATESIYGI